MITARLHCFLLATLLALSDFSGLRAEVPHMIDYQGRIAVAGVDFTGAGQFKFALVNGAGDTTYWSHDGSGAGGAAPATHVARAVTAGLYSIVLGDTTVLDSSGTPVQALDPAAFDHPEVRLRVWFNDGTNGFQLLAPDRRIAAVGYALMADSVPDGSITTAKLAPGSVTADKLAASVGGGGGNLRASLSGADPALLSDGFVKIQSVPAPLWEGGSTSGAPSPRSHHTAVWNGSGMMVWGGKVGPNLSNQGGTYVPATGEWSALPTNGVSPARTGHTGVWAGDRMIVWGGFTNDGESRTGAFYAPPAAGSDPPVGGWQATAVTDAPLERSGHTAVWTGTKMLVWGGKNSGGALGDGGAYTPPTGALVPGSEGSWETIESSGAPEARHGHSAVWTGTRLLVWGGLDSAFQPLGNGGIYDPATNTWTTLATDGAPSPRAGHTAVWTGTRMLVFGGANAEIPDSEADLLADGSAFDPEAGVAGEWMPLSNTGVPSERFRHGAVWSGSEMLVFGGEQLNGGVATGAAAYQPATDAWRVLPPGGAASAGQTGVWSGAQLLVFGTGGLRILDPAPAFHLYGKF